MGSASATAWCAEDVPLFLRCGSRGQSGSLGGGQMKAVFRKEPLTALTGWERPGALLPSPRRSLEERWRDGS